MLKWGEVLDAHKQAMELPVADAVFEGMSRLVDSLNELGVFPTARRQKLAQFLG